MGSRSRRPDAEDTITVTKSDGWFVAIDEETDVASQGETKADALENLAEALSLRDAPVAEEDEPSEPADAPWL